MTWSSRVTSAVGRRGQASPAGHPRARKSPRLVGASTPGSGGGAPIVLDLRGHPLPGTRLMVYWTDECRWFEGTAGVTRGDGATRVIYDPVGDWISVTDRTDFHVLAQETWRML